jgi:hypothetical protein
MVHKSRRNLQVILSFGMRAVSPSRILTLVASMPATRTCYLTAVFEQPKLFDGRINYFMLQTHTAHTPRRDNKCYMIMCTLCATRGITRTIKYVKFILSERFDVYGPKKKHRIKI